MANSLSRSGVERIKLIDPEIFTEKSLNHSSFGLREDIGGPKVEVYKEYIKKVALHIQIEAKQITLGAENLQEELLPQTPDEDGHDQKKEQRPDYIIDCTRNLDLKLSLAKFCKSKKLRYISLVDFERWSDLQKVHFRDIKNCHLGEDVNYLKTELNKQFKIKKGMKLVYSSQILGSASQGVNPSVPGLIGLMLSSYVLCDIAGQKYDPSKPDCTKSFAFLKMIEKLRNSEIRYKLESNLKIEDLIEVYDKVWNSRSAISGRRGLGHLFAIWDKTKPIGVDNIILVEAEHAKKINNCPDNLEREEIVRKLENSEEVTQRISQALEQAKQLQTASTTH